MSFPLRFDISLKLLPAMAERVPHFAVDRAKRTLTRDVELGRRVFWWTGPGLGTEYWLRTVALEITHAMADGRSGREQPVIPVVVECAPGQRKTNYSIIFALDLSTIGRSSLSVGGPPVDLCPRNRRAVVQKLR